MKNKKTFSAKMPKGFDKYIQFSVLALAVFGSVMVISASMTTNTTYIDLVKVGFKQVAYLCIGYIGMVFLAKKFSFDFVKRHIMWIMGLTLFFLLIPLVFPAVGGAKAWIRIPVPGFEVTIQPSEFAKIVSILVMATYLGDQKSKVKSIGVLTKIPFFFIIACTAIIVLFQKDVGTAVVLLGINYLIFLLPGHPVLRRWQLVFVVMIFVGLTGIVWIMTPSGIEVLQKLNISGYQIERFQSAVNPFVYKQNGGYQLVNSLVAFVKGKWFGVGLGKSLQKYGYLPAAKTDFILAITVEETGIAGFFVILACYLTLIVRLFAHSIRVLDEKSRMVLVGVALYLLLHFILNVGGVTAFIPLTGVPLLLVSQGGSSTMAVMFALGIAQNIIARSRQGAEL